MDQKNLVTKRNDRGKQTLFRASYQHQSKLIQLADYKANMIITISTMIISGLIAIAGYGIVIGNLESFQTLLMIPVILIMLSCLASLILAVQVARPKLIFADTSTPYIQKSSLLFFGVIARHSQEEYLEKMKNLLTADTEIYEHQTIDLYNQGLILRRKYNLLGYAFQVLMIGFVVSVLFFLVFFLMEL
jgi:hypothetical protein